MAHALYRTYRPRIFKDIVGQETIVPLLLEAARTGAFAHAYLFAGPRGTGKTTTARILAKVANCIKRSSDPAYALQGEPCNECVSCTAIDEGHMLDVTEIDAASNRGIDDIRALKESVRLSPSASAYRIFIIDEAHQLTKDAWNGLLKTIEEPPAYIIMVFATTEADKVPATILSRTQQFYFQRLPLHRIVEKLTRVSKEESITIDHEALDTIATMADGSVRDAESILGQVVASGVSPITVGAVEKLIGAVSFHTIASLAEHLITGNLDKALASLGKLYDSGHNIAECAKNLIIHLRRVAVLTASPTMRTMLAKEVSNTHLETLSRHAEQFKPHHLALIKTLIAAYRDMRYSPFPIIPFEVALIESIEKRIPPQSGGTAH